MGAWLHKTPMSPVGLLVVHPHLTAADTLQRSSGLARMCMLREQNGRALECAGQSCRVFDLF